MYENFTNIIFFLKLGAEKFPVMPPDSVTVEMTDGSMYGRLIYKMRELEQPPLWMEGRLDPKDHFAYIHFENNHRFSTSGCLNFLFALPGHAPLLNGPKKAYLRIGEKNYFSTTRFENFHLQMTNFDRSNHIFVTMPRGPILSAKLVKHNEDIQERGVTPLLLKQYTQKVPRLSTRIITQMNSLPPRRA